LTFNGTARRYIPEDRTLHNQQEESILLVFRTAHHSHESTPQPYTLFLPVSLPITDGIRLEAAEMRLVQYAAGYTVWDKERRCEIRSQLGMGKLAKQTHARKN
jgi:hypothetical protein